ncbi:hypothetical protein [Tropicimonas isoalkanivorans]|uniref:Inhibitor of g-type lysozyme n=1 Tax=Tropicimonas isoalkanivorans TaxID=441112 RepID=A0A1I1GB62_9RHOB|nr:hypothetical protein [Tropicimonas isoalkanivorans]SFC08552.1 hypothetical protein SAMN04488094_102483 [Tropicimonas isoalkanivorans]
MNRPIAIALAGALTLGALSARAQQTGRIQFEPGNDNAAVSGTITGDAYADYVLGASAGQTMAAALSVESTDGTGSPFFNILPPGSDNVAIFNGSMSPDGYDEVDLPESGDYTIRVYLMGNDRDTGKTVGYTLSVTIE